MEFIAKVNDLNKHEKACLTAFNHCATYSCNSGSGEVINTSYTTCHSQIRGQDPKKINSFSGVYDFYKPGAKELWEFLISETGPFKDLRIFDGVYLFGHKEDEPRGFTLPDHVWQVDHAYPLLYAFLICTRIPHEHEKHAESFAYLIAAGHDPSLMFILSKYLAIVNGLLTASGVAWTSGHNALVESSVGDYYGAQKYIDVRAFCRGEYDKTVGSSDYTSLLWKMKKPKRNTQMLSQFVWAAYSEDVKTRFTTIRRIPSEMETKMVEDFKKFVDMRYED